MSEAFEKKHYNHSEWAKGRFSEAVTITGPGKLIFLAGIGAEDEVTGGLRHVGDVVAQTQYAYNKLRTVLAEHGATLADVVKQVTYVTDIRFCRCQPLPSRGLRGRNAASAYFCNGHAARVSRYAGRD